LRAVFSLKLYRSSIKLKSNLQKLEILVHDNLIHRLAIEIDYRHQT